MTFVVKKVISGAKTIFQKNPKLLLFLLSKNIPTKINLKKNTQNVPYLRLLTPNVIHLKKILIKMCFSFINKRKIEKIEIFANKNGPLFFIKFIKILYR